MNKNEIMEKVKEVIKKYHLTAPVDLNKILEGEKIDLKKIDQAKIKNGEKGEIWAFLIPKDHSKFKNEKTTILISSVIQYPNSIRFTIAHELGHYFLNGRKVADIVYRKKFISEPNEYKYNQFAINLLIPNKAEFKKKYEQEKIDKYDLAGYYGVPIAGIEIFIKELDD